MHATFSQTKGQAGLKLGASILGLLMAAVPTLPAQSAAIQLSPDALPAGSVVTVRLVDGIDPRHSPDGAEFSGTVDAPVIQGDRVVFRRGTPATVRLVQAGKKDEQRAEHRIELVSIGASEARYALETTPQRVSDIAPRSTARSRVGKGAVFGAIAGGLVSGRIGVVLGAGAGALIGEGVHAARDRHDRIAAETQVDFVLLAPVVLK
jgi:hypothetical protein